jgi:hypothetical protein
VIVELGHVQLSELQRQQVAGPAATQNLRRRAVVAPGHRFPPDSADIDLHIVRRAGRRRVTPDRIDYFVPRDGAVGPQGEHRQHRPPKRRPQRQFPPAAPGPDRSQQLDTQLPVRRPIRRNHLRIAPRIDADDPARQPSGRST